MVSARRKKVAIGEAWRTHAGRSARGVRQYQGFPRHRSLVRVFGHGVRNVHLVLFGDFLVELAEVDHERVADTSLPAGIACGVCGAG